MNILNVNDIKEQLESHKAQSIVVLHVSKKTIICDYMVLATVDSHRQMKFIANSLLSDFGGKRQYTDNSADEDWMLIDLGDIMVHIMTPEARVDIDLESLWSDPE